MATPLVKLKAELKRDPLYLRYRGLLTTAAQMIPYESLCEELTRIQASRTVRAYNANNLQPRELLGVSLEEVSHRARLTEILVICKRRSAELEAVIDKTWVHASTEYAECLVGIRTKGERDALVSSAFASGQKLLSEIRSLIDQCESVIKEIDQTSFALQRVANLFELLIRKEHLANVNI